MAAITIEEAELKALLEHVAKKAARPTRPPREVNPLRSFGTLMGTSVRYVRKVTDPVDARMGAVVGTIHRHICEGYRHGRHGENTSETKTLA